MPKYEIGYILSSGISDDEIPNVTSEISKSLEASGAKILDEDHWGRKKLAYPIGRTRNGYYAFLTVDLPSEKAQEVEQKLKAFDGVIRFIVLNMEEADRRRAKDEAIRAANKPPQKKSEAKEEREGEVSDTPDADLDKEIEKAISGEEENV